MLPHLQTHDGITVMLGNKPRTISADHPDYQAILKAIKTDADEGAVREILDRDLNRVTAAVKALADQSITDEVTVRGGQVCYQEEPINNTLTERILESLNEGFNLVPMARFLANEMLNPSRRAIAELYPFLEYGKNPLTEDGCFLAYKAVRSDYFDIYTGTFDNSVGKVCEMRRNQVDEDQNRTCSQGLHVCSFDYLPHFAHANGHVMIVKVNPRDVVSVPTDYKNTKMRVCRYEVIAEYENYYVEHPECLLSKVSVMTRDKPFVVEVTGGNHWDCDSTSFATLSEASKYAEEAFDEAREGTLVNMITVRNHLTGAILLELVNENYEEPIEQDWSDEDEDEDDDGEDDHDGGNDDDESSEFAVHVYESQAAHADGDPSLVKFGFDDVKSAREFAFRTFRQGDVHAVEVREVAGNTVLTTIV